MADTVAGTDLIAAERKRQIEVEGWTPEHDDEHSACELTMAAHAYTYAAVGQINGVCWPDIDGNVPNSWPWEDGWWKPSVFPIRNLVKAGALIAAEIDRLLRVMEGAVQRKVEFEPWDDEHGPGFVPLYETRPRSYASCREYVLPGLDDATGQLLGRMLCARCNWARTTHHSWQRVTYVSATLGPGWGCRTCGRTAYVKDGACTKDEPPTDYPPCGRSWDDGDTD